MLKIPATDLCLRAGVARYVAGLAALCALTACDSYSDSGKWSGTLTAHDDFGQEKYACPVDADVTHTDQMVSLNSVDSYCGERSLHWSPNAFEVQDDELLESETQVGEIGPTGAVTVDLKDPSASDHYPNRADRVTLHWEREGDALHFSLVEITEGHALTLEGSMQRR